jgi:hypothetical protein
MFEKKQEQKENQKDQEANARLIDKINGRLKNPGGHFTVNICNDTCINNHYHIIAPGNNELAAFLTKYVELMVKDSSITAPMLADTLIKELPLMVKDSSITLVDLFAAMEKVREKLLSGN